MEPSFGNTGGWAPPPPPPPPPVERQGAGKPWVFVLLGVLVVGGLAVALMVLLDPFGAKKLEPVAVAPTSHAPPAPESVQPSSPVAEPTPSASTKSADPQAEATKKLNALRNAEAPVIDSMMGSWVVQLASAKVGADDKAFLSKRESLAHDRGVSLTTTEHFYNRRETGDKFWVVFADKSFDSKEEAESWCAAQGLGERDFQLRELRAP